MAEAMMPALLRSRAQALTGPPLQIRAETHLLGDTARLIAAVRRHRIGYVVFNNHLVEGLHMARIAPTDFAPWAGKVGKSAEEPAVVLEAAAAVCGAEGCAAGGGGVTVPTQNHF